MTKATSDIATLIAPAVRGAFGGVEHAIYAEEKDGSLRIAFKDRNYVLLTKAEIQDQIFQLPDFLNATLTLIAAGAATDDHVWARRVYQAATNRYFAAPAAFICNEHPREGHYHSDGSKTCDHPGCAWQLPAGAIRAMFADFGDERPSTDGPTLAWNTSAGRDLTEADLRAAIKEIRSGYNHLGGPLVVGDGVALTSAAHPQIGVELKYAWPFPTPEMLDDPLFKVIEAAHARRIFDAVALEVGYIPSAALEQIEIETPAAPFEAPDAPWVAKTEDRIVDGSGFAAQPWSRNIPVTDGGTPAKEPLAKEPPNNNTVAGDRWGGRSRNT